eukprot:TRINITY_DN25624_c0_g1_i1.p2 TRINITY_DN25624_c0_g1~~TRINITY_DN25624_c0_g1_i1.p2  ORF type:complete len:149 (+),score=36.09 TRINITY_DN25624_c0_g1_i1:60-506(+)
MGKRRSRKAAPQKAKVKLPNTFDCPFCNHQSTIFVKIGKLSGIGKLECRVCGVKAESRTTHLTSEVDVFCEWMDSCVAANADNAPQPVDAEESDLLEPPAKKRKTDQGRVNEVIAAALEQTGDDASEDPYSDRDSFGSDLGLGDPVTP